MVPSTLFFPAVHRSPAGAGGPEVRTTSTAAATAPAGLPENLKAGMAATGAFPSSTTLGSSRSVLPTDAAQAATLLDAAGWVLGGDGIRAKAGVAPDAERGPVLVPGVAPKRADESARPMVPVGGGLGAELLARRAAAPPAAPAREGLLPRRRRTLFNAAM